MAGEGSTRTRTTARSASAHARPPGDDADVPPTRYPRARDEGTQGCGRVRCDHPRGGAARRRRGRVRSRPDPRYADIPSIEREAWYHEDARLERAWALPVARTYRARFDPQRNGSFCGPTSVVNVVRSTGGDADQNDVLEGTEVGTVLGFLPGGLTLEQVAEVARARLPDRTISVHRDLDLEAFRALMRRANDPGVRMIVNFHRGPLFSRGGGHHSPISGCLRGRGSRLRARRERRLRSLAGAHRARVRGHRHDRSGERPRARRARDRVIRAGPGAEAGETQGAAGATPIILRAARGRARSAVCAPASRARRSPRGRARAPRLARTTRGRARRSRRAPAGLRPSW